MTRRYTIGLVATVIFNFVNLGGAAYAVAVGEALHAGTHVALLLPGGWLLWWLAARRSPIGAVDAAPVGEFTNRLTNLEHSLDAVAIEVDRMGEGQRFMTELVAAHDDERAQGKRAAESVEIERKGSSS